MADNINHSLQLKRLEAMEDEAIGRLLAIRRQKNELLKIDTGKTRSVVWRIRNPNKKEV